MEANVELTEIQQFYKNRTIFLTGVTGLLGKLVLEKILRSLHVKHVYVLVRGKNGVDAEARCSEALDSLAFEPLKRNDQEFFKKVSLILGDCEKPDLGLSDYDKNVLINEVECIFHCAAAVKLDTPLKTAAFVNVRATRDLMNIAKQIKNLRTFVFVSSVYSNFPKYEVHEQFYDIDMTAENLIAEAEAGKDDALKILETEVLKEWPNNYTYTMNIAEDLIKRQGKSIPLCIVRPSLIVSTDEEPVTGYIENISGLQGYTVAHALGVNRVNYYKKGTLDVVPIDYVVNLIIASGWYTGLQKIRVGRGEYSTTDPAIYHCISSQEKPISTDEWMGAIQTACREVPSAKMIQLPTAFNTACYQNYIVLTFFLHTCMAFICDSLLKLAGKTPVVMELYRKLHRDHELFSPYLLKQWYFSNDNTQKLLKRMSFRDRSIYNFDILSLNWQSYFVNYVRGVRVYLLKDPMSTLGEGKKRQTKKLLVQLTSVAVVAVALYIISKILFKVALKMAKIH